MPPERARQIRPSVRTSFWRSRLLYSGGEAVRREQPLELQTSTPELVSRQVRRESGQENWYAVYTWARHEKKVATQMQFRKLRGFLPLYRSLHRWKDRCKEVELALFPSYVFVCLSLSDRLRVLEIPGVVGFVTAGGKPAPLPEPEIGALLCGATGNVRIEPHPYLRVGSQVRLRSGPMAGLEGVLLRRKENAGLRLVVSIEMLMRSVAVEVDEADVQPF
jgi:transcription antitermination factor NusG